MKIIGLTGDGRSGKSTAALHLQQRGFVRVGFGDPIKAMLRLLGLGDVHLTGVMKEEPCPLLLGKSPRLAMQTLGTEWGRACIDPRIWAAHWERTACDVLDHGGSIVADDLREEVDANTVRKLGGIVIRLVRPDAPTIRKHATEGQQFAADITIHNTGTISQLHAALNAHLFEH